VGPQVRQIFLGALPTGYNFVGLSIYTAVKYHKEGALPLPLKEAPVYPPYSTNAHPAGGLPPLEMWRFGLPVSTVWDNMWGPPIIKGVKPGLQPIRGSSLWRHKMKVGVHLLLPETYYTPS